MPPCGDWSERRMRCAQVDKTQSRLGAMHAQLRRIANDKDRGKYCVIVCLLILLVVLISMVLES